jgi:ribosome biogenesis GTPase / thiamine phosphate phosphatase
MATYTVPPCSPERLEIRLPVHDIHGLEEFGYSPAWQALFERYADEGLLPARVIRSDRGSVLVAMATGLAPAKSAVRLRRSVSGPAEMPAVGDWVAVSAPEGIDFPQIEAVLERTSAITRGDPGRDSDTQVLAANVDTVFIAHPIAESANLRRIERELSLVWDSGARPVVVLTKSDLSADVDAARAEVETVALGIDVLVTSALRGEGHELLLPYSSDHRTAVLIGPSGAGKSTLINALLGEERQATREVRVNDGRGRHATVVRELIQIPGGGLLIDTPGLRALGLTGSEEGISSAFPDIGQLALSCRFRDCAHVSEPGCAVLLAVKSGELAAERLASYHKLLREAQLVAAKTDARLRAEEGRKWKIMGKAAKSYYKQTGRK